VAAEGVFGHREDVQQLARRKLGSKSACAQLLKMLAAGG